MKRCDEIYESGPIRLGVAERFLLRGVRPG